MTPPSVLMGAPAPRRPSAWPSTVAAVLIGLALGIGGSYYFGVVRSRGAEVPAVASRPAEAAPPPVARADDSSPAPGTDADTTAASAAEPEDARPAPQAVVQSDVERAAAPAGQLLIRSTPSGAMVTIDGRLSGETPLTARDLSMGAHVVQVARPGHVPRLERITLVPSAPSRTLTVALEPGVEWVPAPSAAATRGAVDVQSRPRGARVIVDGRFVGQAPLRVVDLRPGLHRVGLELGGYHSIDTQVRVDAGRSAPLRVTLQSVQ